MLWIDNEWKAGLRKQPAISKRRPAERSATATLGRKARPRRPRAGFAPRSARPRTRPASYSRSKSRFKKLSPRRLPGGRRGFLLSSEEALIASRLGLEASS